VEVKGLRIVGHHQRPTLERLPGNRCPFCGNRKVPSGRCLFVSQYGHRDWTAVSSVGGCRCASGARRVRWRVAGGGNGCGCRWPVYGADIKCRIRPDSAVGQSGARSHYRLDPSLRGQARVQLPYATGGLQVGTRPGRTAPERFTNPTGPCCLAIRSGIPREPAPFLQVTTEIGTSFRQALHSSICLLPCPSWRDDWDTIVGRSSPATGRHITVTPATEAARSPLRSEATRPLRPTAPITRTHRFAG
jgi:hypothetical protein